MGLLESVGMSLAGGLNRNPFVQDLKISAMTSLLTAAPVLPMVAMGVVCNGNKPGLDMTSSVHIHPSSHNKGSPQVPLVYQNLGQYYLREREREIMLKK